MTRPMSMYRKFNGKRYILARIRGRKASAVADAKELRGKGILVRVVKSGDNWVVWANKL